MEILLPLVQNTLIYDNTSGIGYLKQLYDHQENPVESKKFAKLVKMVPNSSTLSI